MESSTAVLFVSVIAIVPSLYAVWSTSRSHARSQQLIATLTRANMALSANPAAQAVAVDMEKTERKKINGDEPEIVNRIPHMRHVT